jgi:hypothetical protein
VLRLEIVQDADHVQGDLARKQARAINNRLYRMLGDLARLKQRRFPHFDILFVTL